MLEVENQNPGNRSTDTLAMRLDVLRAETETLFDTLSSIARDIEAGAATRFISKATLSPLSAAARYFRELLHLSQFRNHYFSSILNPEPNWEMLVHLMIARLEQRDFTRAEFIEEMAKTLSEPANILDRLIADQLVETFPDPARPDQQLVTLSGETARRMTEYYRTREAA